MDNLEDIVQLCRKHRITKYKCKDFEIEVELDPHPDSKNAANEIAAIMEKQNKITKDDILFDPYAGMDED